MIESNTFYQHLIPTIPIEQYLQKKKKKKIEEEQQQEQEEKIAQYSYATF